MAVSFKNQRNVDKSKGFFNMPNMLIEMIGETVDDIFSPYSTIGDRVLASSIVLLMLATIAIIAFVLFTLVNSVGITATETVRTRVDFKEVIPAHSTTTYMMSGKVMVPMITNHPESYSIHFNIGDQRLSSTVKKSFFDNLDVGETIEVDYGFGRLTGSYEPVRFRLSR